MLLVRKQAAEELPAENQALNQASNQDSRNEAANLVSQNLEPWPERGGYKA